MTTLLSNRRTIEDCFEAPCFAGSFILQMLVSTFAVLDRIDLKEPGEVARVKSSQRFGWVGQGNHLENDALCSSAFSRAFTMSKSLVE